MPEGDDDASLPTLEDQDLLLQSDDGDSRLEEETIEGSIKNAIIFSADTLKHYDPNLLPQHGLLGKTLPAERTNPRPITKGANRLFQNTNTPASTFICGLQGSGKSHTLSCLVGTSFIASRSR